MIGALLHRWRARKAARIAKVGLATDLALHRQGGDLDAAFWHAFRRVSDPATTAADRRSWRDVMDEIDRRRPTRPARADTATRMVFRDQAP